MHSLFDAAYQCIIATEIDKKVALTRETTKAWQNQQLSLDNTTPVVKINQAGKPENLQLVAPRDVPKRKLHSPEGKVALLHALAHIEFNAINLAWDAVYRFRDLPQQFYSDWITVADEEAYHFSLLHDELQKLGHKYGDLPAHNGLWEMAVDTDYDVLVRMALVPRLLEARGLDATPAIIQKLQQHGEPEIVAILDIILRDEIGHVAKGTHWYHYCCQQRQLEPEKTFYDLIDKHFRGKMKTTLNYTARLQAGFTDSELATLKHKLNA